MRKPINTLDFAEQLKVYEFLKSCLRTDEEFGLHYINGFDDQAVARTMSKTLDREVTVANVQTIRRKMFGDFVRGQRSSSGDRGKLMYRELEARVIALEESVNKLLRELGD